MLTSYKIDFKVKVVTTKSIVLVSGATQREGINLTTNGL
jgi:hypothetical protein